MCTVVALGTYKIRVCQGVSGGTKLHFELFFEIFCFFLQFSTSESCYFTISLEYPKASSLMVLDVGN